MKRIRQSIDSSTLEDDLAAAELVAGICAAANPGINQEATYKKTLDEMTKRIRKNHAEKEKGK